MNEKRFGSRLRSLFRMLGSRKFAVALMATVVAGAIFAVTYACEILYVVDGSDTSVALVRRGSSDEEVLEQLGITLGRFDTIEREAVGNLYGQLSVVRGLSATLVVDGVSNTYSFENGTVGELLAAQNIALSEDDYCSAAESRILSDGDVITVNHIERRKVTETVAIPYETTYKSSSLIPTGRERLVSAGESGTAVNTYEELWNGGELVSRTLISSRETKAPVDQLILRGQAGVPVSRIDWSEEFPLDENGIPLNYAEHYSNRLATGYSAGENAYGAGGSFCYNGTVAVHTNMYPYGTKLYIRSADGRFVYGYALANDTGGLKMPDGRTIDFDLYYETFRESALNGLRTVEVYVLEWGDGRVYR